MENRDTEGEIILVDKPVHWTSFDVVKKLRYALNVKKIGHAGTLDPLATGLLILCTGKMTKQISGFQEMQKEYTGEFTIGAVTPSYDLETEIENITSVDHITNDDIERARKLFLGDIQQVPPQFSAIKVGGQRAYESARKGKKLKLEPRTVNIGSFELSRTGNETFSFRITCSKGTYIRSMAHDFGQALGTGAYLSSLRRTRIGNFKVEDAKSIEELTAK